MKYFTLYYTTGERCVGFGNTIDDAIVNIGNDPLKTIEWYVEGVTETHWFDKITNQWVRYSEFIIDSDLVKNYTFSGMSNLLSKHNSVTIEYKTKDRLTIQQKWSTYYLYNKYVFVKHLSVYFAEYCKGTHTGCESSENEDEYYFMIHNTEHFTPENIDYAIESFLNRNINRHSRSHPNGENLNQIHDKQEVKYEY